MLLFPKEKMVSDDAKIGFTITNSSPSEQCSARIFFDDTIIAEIVLNRSNNFYEIPITAKNFNVKFQFYTTSDRERKFSISNITWATKNGRRNPICIFDKFDTDLTDFTKEKWGSEKFDSMHLVNLHENYNYVINETCELNFKNFLSNDFGDDWIRIKPIELNGETIKICVPHIFVVPDFKKGIGVLIPTPKVVPWCYTRPKLRIIQDLNAIAHRDHFIKISKIGNIDDYFKYLYYCYSLCTLASDPTATINLFEK